MSIIRLAPLAAFVILFACMALPVPASAAELRLKGWEPGTDYDKLYIPADREKFKGTIDKVIDIEPMDGMDTGYGLIVIDRSTGEEITVHVGPQDFVSLRPGWGAMRPGAKVKVYGVYNDLGGEEIFILNKIVSGDQMVKVRKTSDGMAWWNLSPEELAIEDANNEVD